MKVIGIIAEYNPFHNGHAYQIAQIRKTTGADYVVVAQSGDFVQRGTPAIIDKYARAKMALSHGADLVLELPTLWATASAEHFAMAGVTLFDKMGCVDGICFGAETDNLTLLTEIADFLLEEPQTYKDALSTYLKQGMPFPAARTKALCLSLPEEADMTLVTAIMSEPNNILAIEYLKAIKKRGSTLTPYLIKRKGAGYHEAEIRTADLPSLLPEVPTASATAIRSILSTQPDATQLADAMPKDALAILTEYLSSAPAIFEDNFSSALGYLLLSRTKDALAEVADSNEEIANRLMKNRYNFLSFSDFCATNKSRDITYTRMSRILLHLLLNITNADYVQGKALDYIPYLRILGFRRASAALLTALKKEAVVPLITKLADASAILSLDALALLEKDIFAADLYEQTKKTTPRSEYTREIVLL